MDPVGITRRLRLGEDSRTALKSVAQGGMEPEVIAREIVAFANARGGQIFLGVEDDGTPTGAGTAQEADALVRQVVHACQAVVHPALCCSVIKVEIKGKLVLVINVPAWNPYRPYRADHRFYIRDASTTREATRDELVRMLQSQNVRLEEATVDGATPEDLDAEATDAFLRAAYGPGAVAQRERYLGALHCIDAGGMPTVAGVLLFGREPERWITDARISTVRFPGIRLSSEMAEQKEITGHLLRQLDGVIAFLDRTVPAPDRVEGWGRIERGIPDTVLREAVLNAIMHRDYRAASQIRIFVFQDRVEVINPDGPLNHLSLDSIRLGGISQRRNPVIAAVMARARRRQSFGMGVPEMIEQMRARGLPEPELEVQGGHFRLVLRLAFAAQGRTDERRAGSLS